MATLCHDYHPDPAGDDATAESLAKKARTAEKAASPTHYLPDELLTEVLLRLPVRSLARFRCVRRSWNAGTTAAGFLERHQALAAARHKLAFLPVGREHRVLATQRRGNNKPVRCGGCPRVVGARACRGLVLVERGCCGGTLFSVCNPSTGGAMELPRLQGEDRVNVASIGFHAATAEYKVVVHPKAGADDTATGHPFLRRPWAACESTMRYGVITLGGAGRGWRYREVPGGEDSALRHACVDGRQPVFADGCLHWTYTHMSRSYDGGGHHLVVVTRGILSFSLADESFRQAPQPSFSAADDVDAEDWCSVVSSWADATETPAAGPVLLSELGGSLCMARDVRTVDGARGQVQVWRLDDYDAGWWSLDYLVDLPGRLPCTLMWPVHVVPLAYLPPPPPAAGGSWDLLLATSYHEVLVYNPCTNAVRTVSSVPAYHGGGSDSLPERADSLRFVLYQESFVHFEGMRYGDGGVQFVELYV